MIISRYRAPLLLLIFHFLEKSINICVHEDEVSEIISELKSPFKIDDTIKDLSKLPGGFGQLRADAEKRGHFIIQKNSRSMPPSSERDIYIRNEKSYLKKRLDFLARKYELWKVECPSIDQLLLKIKKNISVKKDSIKLSTIHRAKGLESKRVFIVNYDLLPHYKSSHKEWERIQERNLKYVAVTRALEELYLVKPEKIEILKEQQSLFDLFPFD